MLDMVTNVEFRAIPKRGLAVETCKKYNYAVGVYPGPMPKGSKLTPPVFCQIGAVYRGNVLVGQKLRFEGKEFLCTGDVKPRDLFGAQLLKRAGRMVIITTGEIDAMVADEAMGGAYPAVSPLLGDGSAVECIRANLEALSAFEQVCLAFDTDKSGQDALAKCATLFAPGKVSVVNIGGYKDADEMRREVGNEPLRQAIWNAAPWRPDGIVHFKDIKQEIVTRPTYGIPYPWRGLTEKTYGMHDGDLITLCAGTGIGKSTIAAEIAYHVLNTTDKKVGLIFLEETLAETGQRLLSLAVNAPLHIPDHREVSDEEITAGLSAVYDSDRVIGYNHKGSFSADDILAKMRYMLVGEGCWLIIFDNLLAVTARTSPGSDERRMLDTFMVDMASLVEETDGCMIDISHLKRPNVGEKGKTHEEGRKITLADLRSSGAIEKFSKVVIAFERDQQAADLETANTTICRVLKSRLAGTRARGIVRLHYNGVTGRIEDEDGMVSDQLKGTFGDTTSASADGLAKRPRKPVPRRQRRDQSNY